MINRIVTRKRNITLLLYIIIVTLICGCNKQITENTDNQGVIISSQDDEYYFEKPTSSGQSMAESDDGYYFFSGPSDSFLYYLDKKTLKTTILCNKPDCLHDNEPDPSRIINCNAFFSSATSNLICYDSNLYVFNPFGEYGSECFYQVSLDGTQRRKVYTFKESPTNIVIHRGYIYYSTSDISAKSDEEKSTKSITYIYRISINDPITKPERIYEFTGFYADICNLVCYGNGLYFATTEYKDSLLENYSSTVYMYNIENDTLIKIGQDMGKFAFCGSSIIYYWDTHTYKCNLDGSYKTQLPNVIGVPLSDSNGRYIYTDTLLNKRRNPKEKRQILVYDLEGNPVKALSIDNLGIDQLYGGDNDYIFLPDSSSKKNEFGNISTLWLIDKSKIAGGNAKIKKIFEFIPKVYYKGYIDTLN